LTLLEILFTEQSNVGLNPQEQLGHCGRHTARSGQARRGASDRLPLTADFCIATSGE
jgi:hypothetical protein